MDYLFFDIEASEGKSICSFGYVLTDDELNIKEKNDILINPKSVFCTSARGKNKKDEKEKGITLAYSCFPDISGSIFKNKKSYRKREYFNNRVCAYKRRQISAYGVYEILITVF